MKLNKGLKLRKKLIGEITKLKQDIKKNNSYLEGSKNGEKFDAITATETLMSKIGELTSLKIIINVANAPIQPHIYQLGEYKALIKFWNEVSVVEGNQSVGYGDKISCFGVHVTEQARDEKVVKLQEKIDSIQDEIDMHNYNTEIPYGVMTDEELALLDEAVKQ